MLAEDDAAAEDGGAADDGGAEDDGAEDGAEDDGATDEGAAGAADAAGAAGAAGVGIVAEDDCAAEDDRAAEDDGMAEDDAAAEDGAAEDGGAAEEGTAGTAGGIATTLATAASNMASVRTPCALSSANALSWPAMSTDHCGGAAGAAVCGCTFSASAAASAVAAAACSFSLRRFLRSASSTRLTRRYSSLPSSAMRFWRFVSAASRLLRTRAVITGGSMVVAGGSIVARTRCPEGPQDLPRDFWMNASSPGTVWVAVPGGVDGVGGIGGMWIADPGLLIQDCPRICKGWGVLLGRVGLN